MAGIKTAVGAPGPRAGLTLLELLIIIALIGVIIFITLPTLQPTQQEEAMDFAKEQLVYLHAREQEYFNAHGVYAPFSAISQDPIIGKRFDKRFAEDKPVVGDVSFDSPKGDGPIFEVVATLPDGTRYRIDQTGTIAPLQ
jgi:type II secretory pathway pseudopilin PulG